MSVRNRTIASGDPSAYTPAQRKSFAVRRNRHLARGVLWLAPAGGVVVGRRAADARKGIESLMATAAKRHRRYWCRRDAGHDADHSPSSVPDRTSTSYVEGPGSTPGTGAKGATDAG